MLLNILQAVYKLLNRRERLRRLSTTLKMNSTTQHCTSTNLSDQAIQFRSAYGIQNSTDNRTMQLALIAEEVAEFKQAVVRAVRS